HLRHRKEVGELSIGHPAIGSDEVTDIRENRGEPAEANRRQHRKMQRQCDGRRRAVHHDLTLWTRAAAMLRGANPSKTTISGNLKTTIPAKANAAKNHAPGRPRCAISSLIPVAISSPAAAAESPLRIC